MFILLSYALFSALLSINVSRNILINFVENAQQVENTANAMKINNDNIYSQVKNNQEKFVHLQKQTNETLDYIRHLRNELISKATDLEIKQSDTLPLEFVNNLDNKDISTRYMIGTDENNLQNSVAGKLKKNLITYKTFVNQLLASDITAQINIKPLLDTASTLNSYTNQVKTWEVNNFYNTILIATIYKLNFLAFEVKAIETEVLKSLRRVN